MSAIAPTVLVAVSDGLARRTLTSDRSCDRERSRRPSVVRVGVDLVPVADVAARWTASAPLPGPDLHPPRDPVPGSVSVSGAATRP